MQMRMQVGRFLLHIEQASDDLPFRGMMLQKAKSRRSVMNVVIGAKLAQRDFRAVMLLDHLDGAGLVFDFDRHAAGHEVEAVHRLVMLAHEVEALGRAGVIVERHAGADDVDKGRASVLDRRRDDRHQLMLVAGERARHETGAELQGQRRKVDGIVGIDDPRLDFEPRSAVAENWPLVRP